MQQAATSSFDCPRCGAENTLASGERFPVCSFCDNTLFLDRVGLVGHFLLPRLVDRSQAKRALKRWMSGNDTVKDLDRKSTVTEFVAITFPMWLFRCREAGSDTAYVEPAAPTPIPQLVDLRLPAGQLEPFSDQEVEATRVDVSIPLVTARGWLEERGVGKIIETSLVEVPLWQARYRFEGRDYQALVDGSTGSVMASVFPEKAESPYVLVALLGLVLFGIEGLLISNLAVKFLAYAVTAVPLGLLAFWVTRKV